MTFLPRHKDDAKSPLNYRNPSHQHPTRFGSGLSPVVQATMASLAPIP
ncbi:phosphatidylglycerophosphatase A, partial [Salmonella enterica]